MGLNHKELMLGVTGSFGSGCSTLAEALKSFEYSRISLSSEIKRVWTERNPQKNGAEKKEPLRKDLQDIGDELRKLHGSEYLAKKAIEAADRLPSDSLVVFDGIRNTAEVDYLRETFPNFFLITVWCPQEIRWERIKQQYNGHHGDFVDDDNRDKNEELEYGQQVQLCVDKADIVIKNDEPHNSKAATVKALQEKIKEYVELLKGQTVRIPHHDEMAMTLAYTSSLRSMCLKRTVGAVITSPDGKVISTGYNENPEPMQPCPIKFRYCYKDSCLKEQFDFLIEKKQNCPYCQKTLTGFGDNYKCPNCNKNLMPAFSPDRGMSRCTAIHAENMAIMNASGKNLMHTILYTTTFPCAQCARQIVYAGISEVVYVEPYPDPDSARFLSELTGRRVRMFQGVKARAFDRVFNKFRQENEKKYSL